MVSTATCKSCGAAIIWSTTIAGQKVPLNPKVLNVALPKPDGTVEIVQGREAHFATCPNAAQHRKPRSRRDCAEPVQCAMCEKMVQHGQPASVAIRGTLLCGRICADGFRAQRQIADGRINADLK